MELGYLFRITRSSVPAPCLRGVGGEESTESRPDKPKSKISKGSDLLGRQWLGRGPLHPIEDF